MSTDKAAIQQRIRDAVSAATDAMTLSDQLFSPDGLFSRLASTEAERRELVRSPLFKDAQRCLSDLQRKEASDFARKVAESCGADERKRLAKLERS